MGKPPYSAKTPEGRDTRHGAYFRCENERDELRRLRPARLARILRRRAACVAEGRGHCRTRRGRAPNENELAMRRAAWRPKEGIYPRGYGKLFMQHIKQADEGCDFDFLEGTAPIPEPEIH